MHDVSDYILVMSENWSDLTLEQESRSLIQFWEYVCKLELATCDIDDSVIRAFRDEQLNTTLASPNSRGKRELAEATVNAKLRRVYHWLHWLEANDRLQEGHVAINGRVTSAIEVRDGKGKLKNVRWRAAAQVTCPLLFKLKGGKTKHHFSKHVPSEGTVDDLHALFFSTAETDFIARRNCLFVDVVNRVGLRRGAANSLFSSDFTEEKILAAQDEFWVVPERQKFNYSFSFPLPIDLAWEIHRFVVDVLDPFIASRQIPLNTHVDRLFLSARTGRPMTDRAMTQIVSKAMRGMGFPKGVGPHSFRWKFAAETLDRSLARRRELGLDTTARSIAVETALLLGQTNPDSLYPYAVASLSKATRMSRADDASTISRLRAENLRLRTELVKKNVAPKV